jgi:hypothetical protein
MGVVACPYRRILTLFLGCTKFRSGCKSLAVQKMIFRVAGLCYRASIPSCFDGLSHAKKRSGGSERVKAAEVCALSFYFSPVP